METLQLCQLSTVPSASTQNSLYYLGTPGQQQVLWVCIKRFPVSLGHSASPKLLPSSAGTARAGTNAVAALFPTPMVTQGARSQRSRLCRQDVWHTEK